jgi:hypothetical protein
MISKEVSYTLTEDDFLQALVDYIAKREPISINTSKGDNAKIELYNGTVKEDTLFNKVKLIISNT